MGAKTVGQDESDLLSNGTAMDGQPASSAVSFAAQIRPAHRSPRAHCPSNAAWFTKLRNLCSVAVLVASLTAGGCTTSLREWCHNGFKVGPNYATPPAPVAPQWID